MSNELAKIRTLDNLINFSGGSFVSEKQRVFVQSNWINRTEDEVVRYIVPKQFSYILIDKVGRNPAARTYSDVKVSKLVYVLDSTGVIAKFKIELRYSDILRSLQYRDHSLIWSRYSELDLEIMGFQLDTMNNMPF